MRRDQNPERFSFKGSGFPTPSNGSRSAQDQGVDSLESSLVLALPVGVVLPGGQSPCDPCRSHISRHQPDLIAELAPDGTAQWSEPGVLRLQGT